MATLRSQIGKDQATQAPRAAASASLDPVGAPSEPDRFIGVPFREWP
jgi:hypothetical protein